MARQDSGWAREEEEVLPRPAPPAGSHVGTERGPGAEPGGGSPKRLRPLRPGLRGRFQGNLPTTINTPRLPTEVRPFLAPPAWPLRGGGDARSGAWETGGSTPYLGPRYLPPS